MGIRVHKILGYGLTDVKCRKNGYINDKRFNLVDGYFAKGNDQERYEIKDFVTHLTNKIKNNKDDVELSLAEYDLQVIKGKNDAEFYKVIEHDSEFGLKNVALFTTFHKDWHRYDDIIDYMELEGIPTPSVRVLDRTIWPYEGYINVKTKDRFIHFTDGSKDKISAFELRRCLNDKVFAKKLDFKKFGFESFKDMNKSIVPIVPRIIHEYCSWLKVFNNDDTIFELKPMIYTVWR